jgi:hypothetical protein
MRWPSVPVMLITGYAGKALDDAELASGMEVMRKPSALDAVAARVRTVLMRAADLHDRPG